MTRTALIPCTAEYSCNQFGGDRTGLSVDAKLARKELVLDSLARSGFCILSLHGGGPDWLDRSGCHNGSIGVGWAKWRDRGV